MLVKETWLNVEDKEDANGDFNRHSYIIGEGDLYEPYTDNIGHLFKSYQKEFGRCVSNIYMGEDKPVKIGWVFEKKMKYEDCNQFYIQETWVELHDSKPDKTVKYHYHAL